MIVKRLKLLTPGDVVVLTLAIIFVIALYVVYWRGGGQSGDYIHVVIAGGAEQKISLLQNRVISFNGLLGESAIQIEGGRVRFIRSPCVSKLCIHQGWANLGGEIIACVPNQISASIVGRENKFDTINF